MGRYLVDADPPVPADAALVLAGDAAGFRIIRAAELVREGFTSTVLVSGPAGGIRLQRGGSGHPLRSG